MSRRYTPLESSDQIELEPGDDLPRSFWWLDRVFFVIDDTEEAREDFDQEKAELMTSLRAAKGADALVRYVARLRKAAEAHIEIVAEQQPKGDQQDDG